MNIDKNMVSQGTLAFHDEEIPINATYASRYSLYINFLENSKSQKDRSTGRSKHSPDGQQERRYKFIEDKKFDSLKLNLNGSTFQFGKCRFISDQTNPQFNGRLFFMEDIYDLYEFFSSNRLINLNDQFKNIAIILPQKSKVSQQFRDFTSNLTFDINAYKSLFDDLDSRYENEEPMIHDTIQNIIIEKEGKEYKEFFDTKLLELSNIVSPFTDEEHAAHGYFFRKQLWDIILTSEFMKRTNLKPRGYAGDSKMMTMIYENDYCGKSTFAKIMHKHPLEAKAAQAVRNRVKIIGDVISDIKSNVANSGEEYKILSLACGPARELENIVSTKENCAQYHFTLFDQDIKAIEDAKGNISKIEQRLGEKLNYSIIRDSIRTIISVPDLSEKWGTFHFVYALGLFDYLTDRVAQAVIPKLFKLLKPGGQMIIGNFHLTNPNRYYMEYWLDWSLYYRKEEDMMKLTNDIQNAEKNIFFDDSQSQMFLRMIKK